jgi:hypothetical protein
MFGFFAAIFIFFAINKQREMERDIWENSFTKRETERWET